MTTVYGVTFVGAREQIEKQLRERKDIPEEECYLAAAYLAKQVSPMRLSFPYVSFISVP
jgi:DNA-directed RNA polymerase, mitochondrial